MAGGLVCPLYVVGNLKENFKNDNGNKTSPDEQVYMNYTSVCVPQSVTLNIEYTHVPAL